MKKLGILLIVAFLAFFSGSVFAQTDEVSGILEVTPPDTESNETASYIIIDAGEHAYKVICEDVTLLKALEAADGKTVALKGTIVPSSEEFVMDSFKVASWQEIPDAVEEITEELPVDDEETVVDGE